MNHSDDPNTDGRRALRAIAPGDELTYDYRRWDLDCEWKLASTPGSFARTLATGSPAARLAVLRVITRVGLLDESVVGLVAAVLTDPDRELRYYAAKSLAKLGPRATPAAKALGVALKDDDDDVRYYAAKSLFKIGAGAGVVVAELTVAVESGDDRIRGYCSRALGNVASVAREYTPRLRTTQ